MQQFLEAFLTVTEGQDFSFERDLGSKKKKKAARYLVLVKVNNLN